MARDKNILLNQIVGENDFSIHELVPAFSNSLSDTKFLTFNEDVGWTSVKGSENLILTRDSSGDLTLDVSIGNPFEGTEIHFKGGQVGVGRLPLHSYKVDIGVPVNTRMTALHIGDGVSGFSLGNATDSGFLPQIIGIGADENDAGLYFLGKTISDVSSNTPLIIFDARNIENEAISNRPIMGISSGSYTDFKFIIDQAGKVGIGTIPEIYKLEVSGTIMADNIVFLDSSNNSQDLKNEIEDLRERIRILEQT